MIKNILKYIIDFLYPPKCHICKNIFVPCDEHRYICPFCKKQMLQSINIANRCKICSRTLIDGKCSFCNKNKAYQNISLFDYMGNIRPLLYDVKYSNNKKLAEDIAMLYEQYIKNNIDFFQSFDYVVSVPMHSKKLVNRTFNQSEVMAMYIAKTIDIPYYPLLVRTKNTIPQSSLSISDRYTNLEKVFDINHNFSKIDIKNKKIIIVDDIFTSGATIYNCGEVLEKNGAKKIISICITVTNNINY